MRISAVCGLLIVIGCGTHLSSLDKERAQNIQALGTSIMKDIPDSGPLFIKGTTLVCETKALELSAGMAIPDGGVSCPKAR
jgi:hypothetical protein